MNKIIVLVALMAVLCASYGLAVDVYINLSNPACNDANTYAQAQVPATSWCNLSKITSASCGDTVLIGNGTYRFASSGGITLSNKDCTTSPLTIKSNPGENVTITGAYERFENVPNALWTNLSDGTRHVWRAALVGTTFDSARYTNNLTSFFSNNTFSDMNSTIRPYGVYADTSYVYIRLPQEVLNPNNIALSIGSKAGATMTLSNISGLIFQNLTFRDCVTKCITATSSTTPSNSITVKDNVFIGPVMGTDGGFVVDFRNDWNISIHNNTLKNDYADGWFWYAYKQGQSEYSAIHLQETHGNTSITNNTIRGYFNGLYIYDDVGTWKNKDLNISGNKFYNIMDDAIELEQYGNNITVEYNYANDTFSGISMIPYNSSTGMTKIRYNIIGVGRSEPFYSTSSNDTGKAIKFEGGTTDYASNIWFDHNTILGRQRANYGYTIKNSTFTNNIYLILSAHTLLVKTGLNTDGIFYDYNNYYRTDAGGLFQYRNSTTDAIVYSSLIDVKALSYSPPLWDVHSNDTNPQIPNYNNGNFTPAIDSPVCNMSDTGSWIGATACLPPPVLTADTTPPTIMIIYPTNKTSYPYYNGTIIINASEVSGCSINDSRWSPVYDNDTIFVWNYTDTTIPPGGYYNVGISCVDLMSNRQETYIEFVQSFINNDAFVDATDPATNFGTGINLLFGKLGAAEENTYFFVNLTRLGDNIIFDEINLLLFTYSSNTVNANVYLCDDNFNENTITYENADIEVVPTSCTFVSTIYFLSAADSWQQIPITNITNTLWVSGIKNFTILIKPDTSSPVGHIIYSYSKDFNDLTSFLNETPYISFSFHSDTIAPVVTQDSYYGYTTNPNITFSTDEDATCLWSLTDVNYTAMTFPTAGNGTTEHWFNYSGFTFINNSFYIACNDSFGNWNTNETNHNGWIYVSNFTLFIYDETTLELLNGTTVYVNVFDHPINFTTTTTTGVIFNISDLPFNNYTISAYAAGYVTRTHYFETTAGYSTTFSMYLLNSSIGAYKVIKIIDENSLPVEGAKVVILREYGPVLTDIGQLYMNAEGESTFMFIENTQYYEFQVYYKGLLVKTTEKTLISSLKDTLTIQLALSENQLDSLKMFGETYKRLYLENNSGVFRYTFVYSGADIRYGRLKVVKSTLSSDDILVGENISYTPGATITVDFVPESSWTYTATGYLDTNSTASEYPAMISSWRLPDAVRSFGLLGLVIAFMVIGVLAFMNADNPTVQIVMAIFALIVCGFVGLMSLSTGAIMLVAAIGVIIIFRNRT
jgi:hypothetical protein